MASGEEEEEQQQQQQQQERQLQSVMRFKLTQLSQSLYSKLISKTNLIYTFTCILFFICCPS